MFNSWYRKLNQNWRTIIAIIIIVAFLILLIRTIFAIMRNNRNKQMNALINNQNIIQNTGTDQDKQNVQNNENINFSSDTNLKTEVEDTIKKFVDYCNNNQVDEAYQMISDDCKSALFPTVEIFNNNYIKQVFSTKKSASIEVSMYGESVYSVLYYEDLLATGGYNSSGTIQDYVYFTKQDDQIKLNINQFLYTNKLEKRAELNSIHANVLKKDVYLNYEVYQIQVTNQTNQTILLSNKQKSATVTLIDEAGIEYSSNITEQADERLIIKPQGVTILSIKFNKMYNPNRGSAIGICFSEVITNYDQYNNGEEAQKVVFNISL